MSIDAQRVMKRKVAKELGLVHYYTGNQCSKGHIAMRYVANGLCVECSAAQSKAWRENNPDQYRATRKKWEEDNREYTKTASRARTEKRAAMRKAARECAQTRHIDSRI